MIKITDIYASVSNLLKGEYGYKIYGNEVLEGYKNPSFFVQLLPSGIRNASTNFHEESYSIVITYFQAKPDSLDNYKKIDRIRELFGQKLQIGTRLVNVTEYDFDFVGDNKNVLQITVEIEFLNGIRKIDTNPQAGELSIKKEMRD